ncbi:hypothetical protein OBBRIDRAFT_859454 [Obba rivulosa]|uniref:BTB domain-containing protein n=1 Tax=Obba rivulosa TaxID=1052685 RepID=A0A8E2ANA4_9APHY|nr:hypothetical protein OBBRIDRAFT_859454 [Obba rivulosa]
MERDAERARAESDAQDGSSATGATELVRDEEFWYDDGSVVLQTGDHGFRVHKAVLSKAAPFFEGLFSVPQPSGQDKVDGCDVVQMQDSCYDIRQLLRLIYQGRSYYEADGRVNFTTVATTIRIAHKFDMQDLLSDALKRLKSWYTDDFDAWDKICEADGSSLMTRPRDEDAIEAVALAHLMNTPSVLPLALYFCAQLYTDVIISGTRRNDGAISRLSPEDAACCIDGRAHLLYYFFVAVPDTRRGYGVSCCIRSCNVKFEPKPIAETWSEKLKTLSTKVSITPTDGRAAACNDCIKWWSDKEKGMRRWYWKFLPQMFGLPTAGWGASGATW